ncbi:hypothetical protein CLAIMM_03123 [Cladophialophora immunda]|nr:hypothetical protein CLAIMM_03123 [Cladophialophora immunda]
MWKISIRFSYFQYLIRELSFQSIGSAHRRTIHTSWWDDRFPDTRTVQVKERGRSRSWKNIKVVLTQHRDKSHRQRRVWFTFNGDVPTAEDFALKWPEEKMAKSCRILRDDEEAQCLHGETPRIFTVTQKTDAGGRRFWREVIKTGESTDEEDDESWDKWMREEGFYAEIERVMKKD